MGFARGAATRITPRAPHLLHRPRHQSPPRPVPYHVSAGRRGPSRTPSPDRHYLPFEPDLYRPGYVFLPGLEGRDVCYRYISRQTLADYTIRIPKQGPLEEGEIPPPYPKSFKNMERFPFLDPDANWLEYPFTLPKPYYQATWDEYVSPGPVRIVYREEDRTDFHVLFHDPGKRVGWGRSCAFSCAVMELRRGYYLR